MKWEHRCRRYDGRSDYWTNIPVPWSSCKGCVYNPLPDCMDAGCTYPERQDRKKTDNSSRSGKSESEAPKT